jgi:hypothetical protein
MSLGFQWSLRCAAQDALVGVGTAATVLALSVSDQPPHLPQKFDVAGLSALHLAQTLANAFPQCAQKLFTVDAVDSCF